MKVSSRWLITARSALTLYRALLAPMFQPNCREEFLARFEVRAEYAEHAARHHGDIRPMHPSRRHAFMNAFDNDADSRGLEHAVEAGSDLGSHLLLDLHSLRVNIDKSHKL